MDKKKLTIARLAELAGVSKATASLVMNGKAGQYRIADETRERVMAVARRYQYQPNLHARALGSRRSHTLGLVIPDLTNFGFASIAKSLESRCRQAGLQLLIACSDDDPELEQQVVAGLVQRQVDALIVASSASDDAAYRQLTERLPVIQLDRHIGQSTLPLVISDACRATAELVQALARGQEAVYFLGGQLALSPSRHRLAGYELGLQRAGIEARPEWIWMADYRPASGYRMMEQLHHELGRLPGALFTASFTLLEGVLRYLNEHHLLAEPIRLGTFDDHELLDCLPIAVDAVAQDCEALAGAAFELCSLLLQGETPVQAAHVVPTRVHWRSRAQREA